MSNNNGKELDDLYLKYFPLIPLLNLPSISASLWYPMISIQPSSKAFSLLLSPLIFLMCGAQRFIPAPLKTSGFSSRDASILFYFPSSPPALFAYFSHLYVFLIASCLPGHFPSNVSLIIHCIPLFSCFLNSTTHSFFSLRYISAHGYISTNMDLFFFLYGSRYVKDTSKHKYMVPIEHLCRAWVSHFHFSEHSPPPKSHCLGEALLTVSTPVSAWFLCVASITTFITVRTYFCVIWMVSFMRARTLVFSLL